MAEQLQNRQIHCTCVWNEIQTCRHKHTCDRNVKAVITHNVQPAERVTIIEVEDDEDFDTCSDCDLPDACADFGCAVEKGLRKKPTPGIF
jgi:hypothetical protein